MQGGTCNPGFSSNEHPPCPPMARASTSSTKSWMGQVQGGHHKPDTNTTGVPTQLGSQQSHPGENSPFLQD